MRGARPTPLLTALWGLLGCASPGGPARPGIAIPPASSPLAVRVVYPPSGATIFATDSTFVFGTVGRGDASLYVNGDSVRVWPNGSWLAWVPLPDDTVAHFVIQARAGTTVVADSLVLPIARPAAPPCAACAWVDSMSLAPAGWLAVPPDEVVHVRARATPGAAVRLRLGDEGSVPLLADRLPEDAPWGVRAFALDPLAAGPGTPAERYEGAVRALDLARPDLEVEIVLGGDTVRRPWPVSVALLPQPALALLTDDPEGTGAGDSLTAGLTRPGGTIHWLFPAGTTAAVSAWVNGTTRLALSPRATAWVASDDALVLRGAPGPPVGVVGALRVVPEADRVRLVIPVSVRAPFHIEETAHALTVRLYGVQANIDWAQYGETDSFVRRLSWDQPGDAVVTVTAELAAPVWGYGVRWEGRTLVMAIRRPPAIDGRQPLRGRVVLLDAGHPPLGSTGPSGQREADVTLAVTRLARSLLEARGARVLLTRDSEEPLSLIARTSLAEKSEAEVLVSIHTNALPDGVNPFVNSGTSTYYYHPRSLPLARAINRAIVAAFGTRDLGVGRADLALARPRWLPAVLVEGLFQMLPEHDAWLATHEGRRRYAQAIADGVESFFRERAASP